MISFTTPLVNQNELLPEAAIEGLNNGKQP